MKEKKIEVFYSKLKKIVNENCDKFQKIYSTIKIRLFSLYKINKNKTSIDQSFQKKNIN